MKIGDNIKIHSYKHNGDINQKCDEATVIYLDDDTLICANQHVNITDSSNKTYRTKEQAILFFYKNSWFNIIAQIKEFGLFFYCNISSPYIIEGGILKYIDYDLDLRVFPDGAFKVLDKNEYKYHKKIMGYSDEIDLIIKNELTNLINIKINNELPFNKKYIEGLCEKYLELKDK